MRKRGEESILSKRGISVRERFSARTVLYSVIVFLVSLIIYLSSQDENILGVTGFLMIISGSFIVLFIIIYLIFYFLENSKYKKQVSQIPKKSKKSVKRKRK